MFINIILSVLIGISFLGLAVIVYRKLAVLGSLSEEELLILARKKSVWEKIKGVDYKHYWLNIIVLLEKFLRKVKILFLKFENFLNYCIKSLRTRSQIMTQKSREWIKQREEKRLQKRKTETNAEVVIKVNQDKPLTEAELQEEMRMDEDNLSLSELKKPIKEEQKWIDLIVENPKNITAYKFLGLLYWKQHNYSDAKASLEMAVKLGSKDKRVQEVLEELRKAEFESAQR